MAVAVAGLAVTVAGLAIGVAATVAEPALGALPRLKWRRGLAAYGSDFGTAQPSLGSVPITRRCRG